MKYHIFDFELVRCYYLYRQIGVLTEEETINIIENIKNLEEGKTRRVLAENFKDFKLRMINQATAHEVGTEYIVNYIEQQLTDFCRQLSLFDEQEWNMH